MKNKKYLIAIIAIVIAVCCAIGALCYFIVISINKSDEHIHNMITVGEKSATCTADGHSAYFICSGCDRWFEDAEGNREITDRESTILPKGHNIMTVDKKDATCTEDGNAAYYVCSGCDKWFEDEEGREEISDRESVIFPGGHKMEPVGGKSATCTEDGNKAYYTCSGCGKWFNDGDGKEEITDKSSVVLAKGHKLEPIDKNDATCTKDGNRAYYSCNGCGKWFEDEDGEEEITDKLSVVLAKGHTLNPVEMKEATCRKDGNKAYYTCGRCGKWFEDGDGKVEIINKTNVVLKKLPHSYENGACVKCGIHTPTEGVIYTVVGDHAEVSDYDDLTETDIVIAEEYNGKPVTSIGRAAFSGCSQLRSVILPDSITSIGDRAFYNSYLTSIILSESLISIGDEAFSCTDLKSIILPDSLLYIGHSAFNGCGTLSEINIPDNLVSIGREAFYDCKFTSITLPDSLVYIGDEAFEDCDRLTSIIIPDSVTYLGSNAFIRCKSLTTATVSANVTVLNKGVFEQCHNLTNVTIRGNVTAIKDYAFYECESLAEIAIPGTVTYIGENAFGYCTSLEEITIPKSVTKICNYAFQHCINLLVINFDGTKDMWKAIEKDSEWDSDTQQYAVRCTDLAFIKGDRLD